MELILVLDKKNDVGKKVSTIAMLGPLLAMPSGQGLNMTLLAILISIASIAVDVKAWTCFFLEDGGMHSKKLHPQPRMNLSYWAVKWDMFETV